MGPSLLAEKNKIPPMGLAGCWKNVAGVDVRHSLQEAILYVSTS
jgi:hypothetical protein